MTSFTALYSVLCEDSLCWHSPLELALNSSLGSDESHGPAVGLLAPQLRFDAELFPALGLTQGWQPIVSPYTWAKAIPLGVECVAFRTQRGPAGIVLPSSW